VGFPQGSIKTTWIPFELNVDRGVKFLLDRIDNDEVLGLEMGRAAQNFTDYQMIPELDAYRFAKYSEGAGKKETKLFNGTGADLLNSIDEAATYMNGLDVPETGRILYVNQDLEIKFRSGVSRMWDNNNVINTRIESYNGLTVLFVPKKRFKTLIELNSGENNEFGFTTPEGAQDINFMIIYPQSVIQASKTAKGKFISADENQRVDSNEFQFRVYHDSYVIDKVKDGVYVSVKPETP
jgi:hypothetical protein